VKSADGRIDGRWPLELVAKPGTGEALPASAITFDWMQQTGTVSLPSWGIHGIDVSGYDSASPNLSLMLGPSSPLSGDLRVTGYKLRCVRASRPSPRVGGSEFRAARCDACRAGARDCQRAHEGKLEHPTGNPRIRAIDCGRMGSTAGALPAHAKEPCGRPTLLF
jgi:hypothetical protein